MLRRLLRVSHGRPLEDCYSSRRASYTANDVEWRAGHKERPPTMSLTFRSQCLQIPHLPQRSPPPNKRPLMKHKVIAWHRWPCLERNCISDMGSKMLVVQPVNHLLIGLDTNSLGIVASARLSLARSGPVVLSDVAGPDHQNVSLPGCSSLVFQSSLEIGQCDFVTCPCIGNLIIALLIVPDLVVASASHFDKKLICTHHVYQKTSTDNTTSLAPICSRNVSYGSLLISRRIFSL